MRSRATDGMSASECQGKRPDQAVKHRSDGRECREPSTLSHLGFQPVQKTPTIHVSSGFIWGIPVMKTHGHARGARRVEGTGITGLRPLADSLDTYARQIHSIAEIIRVIEEESAEQSTEAKAAENTAPCSPHDGQQHLTSTLPAVGWRPLPVISDTLDRTPVIQAHAAPVVDTISPEAICQRALGARKAAEARAKEWVPDRLCAMEQNSVRASDGKLLLALKVIAAVIGIIGIPLLAFSFGQIKPFGSAAHLAIENQKGLTIEPLPLGISVADGSGGETVTVGGLAEGTELSFGTALGSGNWLVPVADLDKTVVGAPVSFVGVMTAKVTLNSATGKRLDRRNVRFEWSTPEPYSAPPPEQTEPTPGPTPATSGRAELTPALGPVQPPPVPETAESLAAPLRPAPSPAAATPRSCQLLNSCPTKVAKNWRRMRGQNGPTAPTASNVGTLAKKAGSNKAQSPPCLASAAEVRKLTPNAWPKWTYGPNGEQCWYSGEKPVFVKTRQ